MGRKFTKPKSVDLKVIKGGGQGLEKAPDTGKKPLFFIQLFLAIFLLMQILFGWIWGTPKENSIRTFLAEKGSIELKIPVSGLTSFDEEIVFSPAPGFIQYIVEEGFRVPAGVELARISESPVEETGSAVEEEEEGVSDYFSRLKEWFLGGDSTDGDSYEAVNAPTSVISPQAGLVSLKIDGWEKFGPQAGFPYFTEEEFNEKPSQEQYMGCGKKVDRYTPLLRIINNYTWYFSAVLPVSSGEIIAEKPSVLLYFSFAPDCPVTGEQVEAIREGDILKITWAISQFVENFFNQRWCSAEIIYGEVEGIKIPKSTLIEKDEQKGVYIVEKEHISYYEVVIIGEKDDYYLVENLEPYEKVVLNPGNVMDGQRFFW